MSQLLKHKLSRTGLTHRSTNPTSPFIERVNDVIVTQILSQTRHTPLVENSSYKDLRCSPITARRLSVKSRPRGKKPRAEKTKKGAKLKVELGSYRLKDVFRSRLRTGFSSLRALQGHDSVEGKAKDEASRLEQAVAMTRCPNCCQRGLTLLTTSTQDKLSPRFYEKVKSILPKSSTSRGALHRRPEGNLILPDISYMEPFVSSDKQEDSFESLRGRQETDEVSFDMISDSTHLNTPFLEKENVLPSHDITLRVPSLSFLEAQTFSRPKTPEHAKIEVKTSPQLGRKNGRQFRGLDAVAGVLKARLRRAFAMISLSRRHSRHNSSAVFSREGLTESRSSGCSRTSRSPFTALLTGENSSMKSTSRHTNITSLKMPAKIMGKRLEKLVHARELLGYYALAENMLLI
jgi:hypothetical protein